MAKKTTTPPEPNAPSIIATVRKNLEASMLALSRKRDAESVATLGRISRAHTQITDAERKREREERRAGEVLTHPAVIAWAKTLSPAERAELARAIAAVDEKRSGLS